MYITFLVTLPAMTTCGRPGGRNADHPAELGHADGLERVQRLAKLRGASYLIPTQATLRPCRRAASANRIGNRPLPASRPIGRARSVRADERS